MDLFRDHGFRLDDGPNTAADGEVDDIAPRVFRSFRPEDVSSTRFHVLLKFQQVAIKMIDRFPLDHLAVLAGNSPIPEPCLSTFGRSIVEIDSAPDNLPMPQISRLLNGVTQKLLSGRVHRSLSRPDMLSEGAVSSVLAKMLAGCIVRTRDLRRRSTPSICIRQLGSVEARNSAPQVSAKPALPSPIAAEIMLNFVANVPPKPQQSSL